MPEQFSFEEMYDEYFDKVNRYLRYRARNHWDADDLTTTVFLKALEIWTNIIIRILLEHGSFVLPIILTWIIYVKKESTPWERDRTF